MEKIEESPDLKLDKKTYQPLNLNMSNKNYENIISISNDLFV